MSAGERREAISAVDDIFFTHGLTATYIQPKK